MAEDTFDAFISYSHLDCGNIAPFIQKGIENVGKPWYRIRRNMEVFRDETNLSASPELWKTIEIALISSNYFILLASPMAATSPWISDEIAVWIGKNYSSKTGIKNIFIVLTDGDIVWNKRANDFDWEMTTCLPKNLQGKFSNEPHWVDLKPYVKKTKNNKSVDYKAAGFTTALTKIIGAILNKDPREVESDELKRRRMIITSIASSSVLFVLIISLSIFFYRERRQQENISKSNYLIYQASNKGAGNVNTALWLYYYAYQFNQDSSVFAILNDFYNKHTLTQGAYKEKPNDTIDLPDTINHFFKTFENVPNFDTNHIDPYTNDYAKAAYDFSLSQNGLLQISNNQVGIKKLYDSSFKRIACFERTKWLSRYFNTVSEKCYVVNNYAGTNSSFITEYSVKGNKLSKIIYSNEEGVYCLLDNSPDNSLTKYIKSLQLSIRSQNDILENKDNGSETVSIASSNDGQFLLICPKTVGKIENHFSNPFFKDNLFNVLLIDLINKSYVIRPIQTEHLYNFRLPLDEVLISADNKLVYFQFNGNIFKGNSLIFDFNFKRIFKVFENNAWSTKFNKEAPRSAFWYTTPKGHTELFYGTDAGVVYIVNFKKTSDAKWLQYVVKCSTLENYGAITSLYVNSNYIFAGTNRGNIVVWRNENSYSQNIELDGYAFLTSIKLTDGTISKVLFDSSKNILFCLNKNGWVWELRIKEIRSLKKNPTLLKEQFYSLKSDTLSNMFKKQVGL
jgi:hypothetical protein